MDTPKADRISRQEQAQQTRQRLFDAAYSLLQEKDFKDITINEIVSRAGSRPEPFICITNPSWMSTIKHMSFPTPISSR